MLYRKKLGLCICIIMSIWSHISVLVSWLYHYIILFILSVKNYFDWMCLSQKEFVRSWYPTTSLCLLYYFPTRVPNQHYPISFSVSFFTSISLLPDIFFIFSHHLYFFSSSPIFLWIFLIDLACLLIFYASHLFSISHRLLFVSPLRTFRKFLTSIPTFSFFPSVFFSCLFDSIF